MSYRNLLKRLEALAVEAESLDRLTMGQYIARKNLIFSKQYFDDPSLPDPDTPEGRKWIAEHAESDEEIERRIAARVAELEARAAIHGERGGERD